MMVSMIMMMVVGLSSHINDGRRYRQHRRILILNELSNTLDDEIKKQGKPNNHEDLHFLLSHFCKEGPTKCEAPLCDLQVTGCQFLEEQPPQ